MCPVVFHTKTVQPHANAIIFIKFSQGFTLLLLVDIIIIAITELKETDCPILMFDVIFNTFEATKQQRLTHAVQICTKRIEQLHTMCFWISWKLRIVSRTRKRIVQNFIETSTTKLFRDKFLHFVAVIGWCFITQTRVDVLTKLHIIIAIDPENIFNNIYITLHIDTIYRHVKRQLLLCFSNDFHFQTVENTFDSLFWNYFTN